jgi:hypothetical protein
VADVECYFFQNERRYLGDWIEVRQRCRRKSSSKSVWLSYGALGVQYWSQDELRMKMGTHPSKALAIAVEQVMCLAVGQDVGYERIAGERVRRRRSLQLVTGKQEWVAVII